MMEIYSITPLVKTSPDSPYFDTNGSYDPATNEISLRCPSCRNIFSFQRKSKDGKNKRIYCSTSCGNKFRQHFKEAMNQIIVMRTYIREQNNVIRVDGAERESRLEYLREVREAVKVNPYDKRYPKDIRAMLLSSGLWWLGFDAPAIDPFTKKDFELCNALDGTSYEEIMRDNEASFYRSKGYPEWEIREIVYGETEVDIEDDDEYDDLGFM